MYFNASNINLFCEECKCMVIVGRIYNVNWLGFFFFFYFIVQIMFKLLQVKLLCLANKLRWPQKLTLFYYNLVGHSWFYFILVIIFKWSLLINKLLGVIVMHIVL